MDEFCSRWMQLFGGFQSRFTYEDVMPVVLSLAVPLVVALCLIRVAASWSWGRCTNFKSQRGRVFIITGANSGLGRETARMLAMRRARVILACRDMASAYLAIEDIRRSTPSGELVGPGWGPGRVAQRLGLDCIVSAESVCICFSKALLMCLM